MPGLFDSIGTNGGILGFLTGHGFGPGGLAGTIDPQVRANAMQQQQQQATYQALVDAGAPPHIATAAALNPQQFGQYAQPYLDQAPKIAEGGVDPFTGQKNFVVQRNGPHPSVTAAPVQPAQGGPGPTTTAQGLADFQKAVESGVTGEELYKHLPETAQKMTRAIVEGRQAISPMMLRPGSPMLPIIEAAHTIDPDLDMSNPAARQKAMIDAKSGTIAQSQRGINQTVHHIVTKLIPAMDETGNTSIPSFNTAKNFVNKQLGGTNTTSFYPTAIAVADEMSRAFKGNHVTDSQIASWKESLNPDMSPDQQHKAVDTLLGLLQGASDSAHEQRVQGIGQINDARMGPMLHEQGQKEIESIKSWIAGRKPPQQATPQSAPGGLPQGWSVKVH